MPNLDEPAAIQFLLEGNGVSFWDGPDCDVFLSTDIYGCFSASFASCTMEEQDALVERFKQAGLAVEVRHE